MWLRSPKWIRRCIIEAGNGFTKTTPIAEPDNMPSDKWFGYYSCIRLIQLLRQQHRATGHTHSLTVGDLPDTSRSTITLLYMLSITGDGHKGYCGNFDRKTSVLCRTTAVDALRRQRRKRRRRRSTKQQDVLALSPGDGWSVSVSGKKW